MVNVPLLYLIVTKNFLLKRLLQNRLNLLYIVYVNYYIYHIQKITFLFATTLLNCIIAFT